MDGGGAYSFQTHTRCILKYPSALQLRAECKFELYCFRLKSGVTVIYGSTYRSLQNPSPSFLRSCRTEYLRRKRENIQILVYRHPTPDIHKKRLAVANYTAMAPYHSRKIHTEHIITSLNDSGEVERVHTQTISHVFTTDVSHFVDLLKLRPTPDLAY